MKRVNYDNTFCTGHKDFKGCGKLTYKGDGVYHNFNGNKFVLCQSCDEKRDKALARSKAIRANLKKAEIKKAYIDSQPTLFDSLKGGE
jgi:hypothetical protein